jgi:hypothetical protein
MKKILFLCFIILYACSEDKDIGTISFTSNRDCEIRLFDSHGRQTGHKHYEAGNSPAVMDMKRSGIYVVYAASADKTIKEPLTYMGENLEYHIEF